MKKLELEVTECFGRVLFYPFNHAAKTLAKFKKCRNFTSVDIECLISLGFEVDFKQKTIDIPIKFTTDNEIHNLPTSIDKKARKGKKAITK